MLKKTTNKPDFKALGYLLALVLVTVAVFLFYRVMMNFPCFKIVMIVYMVLSVVVTAAYLIYNRGTTGRKMTREMLSDDWSEEKKDEFLEESARRQKKSKWMIIPIFAFFFTALMDAMELFVIPFFAQMFSR